MSTMDPHEIIGVVAASTLLVVVVLQLLLAAGLPLGQAAWGGRYRVLPPTLRWGSLAAAVVLGGAAWAILARAGLVAPGEGSLVARTGTWVFGALFALNTLGNAVSPSRTERYAMTPVTILLCGCFLTLAWAS